MIHMDGEYKELYEVKKLTPFFVNEEQKKQVYDGLLYQYRKICDFWKIVKGDSFWATNARFSNDEEEQKFGMQVINTIYHSLEPDGNVNTLGLDDNYIVCFCKENDKLSQWRGYAPDGGVALGFDFSSPQLFTILNKSADVEKDEWGKDSVEQYVDAAGVCYIDDPEDFNIPGKTYEEYLMETLGLINPTDQTEGVQIAEQEVLKKAPYIKHIGFYEENESRLVFRGDKDKLKDCIRYRLNENKNIQYPYIIARAGVCKEKESNECKIRIGCSDEKTENEIFDCIRNKIKAEKEKPHRVETCYSRASDDIKLEDEFCSGCTLRKWHSSHYVKKCRHNYGEEKVAYQYRLKAHNEEVIISQGKDQEKIFRIVHACIQEYNKKNTRNIKVWCEGHLPLRKITVGPCRNSESNVILEAIKHYCRHVYWLEDVEVVRSRIPYRASI